MVPCHIEPGCLHGRGPGSMCDVAGLGSMCHVTGPGWLYYKADPQHSV